METKSIRSVLDIILECYNAQLTQDSFMELALMKLEPSEPPYQFYLRMCDHMRKHLPKRDVEVKNIRVTVDQEPMSVALYNTIALMWLKAIDHSPSQCLRKRVMVREIKAADDQDNYDCDGDGLYRSEQQD